jgi:mannan endo-1,4-beta-mannosidase
MKTLLTITLCAFIHFFASAQIVNPHFYTQGNLLKDPCGNTFNIKGINYAPYNWGSSTNELLLRQISKTGANTVRLVWYANNPDVTTHSIYTTIKLGQAIDTCLKYGMLPIVELHDQTCQNSPTALVALSNYFLQTDVKTMLQARQNKIIINIANEALFVAWDGNPTTAQVTFKNTYNTIVSNMRTNGYVCPIMIDGPECGTNSDVLAAVGSAIIAADTKHNILFSVHTYWYGFANNDVITMQQKLQTIINANVPFVLGEIANQQDDQTNCQYNLDYQGLLTVCQNLNVNWIPWSWYRDVCPARQMTSTGNYANLTPYGNDLVNNTIYGIKNKAVKSPYLVNNTTCVVATEKTVNANLDITIRTESDAWQIISAHTEPLQAQLFSINGQLLHTTTLPANSDISIQKPDARGIFILKLNTAAGLVENKKLVN